MQSSPPRQIQFLHDLFLNIWDNGACNSNITSSGSKEGRKHIFYRILHRIPQIYVNMKISLCIQTHRAGMTSCNSKHLFKSNIDDFVFLIWTFDMSVWLFPVCFFRGSRQTGARKRIYPSNTILK